MDKQAYNRAHRRMVRDTFSPGWTPQHRARRGYVTPHSDKGWQDSHGKRGRKPRKPQSLTRRKRCALDTMLFHIVADDRAPMERPGSLTHALLRRIQ